MTYTRNVLVKWRGLPVSNAGRLSYQTQLSFLHTHQRHASHHQSLLQQSTSSQPKARNNTCSTFAGFHSTTGRNDVADRLSQRKEAIKRLDQVDSLSDDNHVDLLIIGGVAVDLSCDIKPGQPSTTNQGFHHTSNPATISDSLGGVGKNLAVSFHNLVNATIASAQKPSVRLISAVGDDLTGRWVLEKLKSQGLDVSGIAIVPGASTARYVAVNSPGKDMLIAAADMDLIENLSEDHIANQLQRASPTVVCFDGNISSFIMELVKTYSPASDLVFEPTSVQKSQRLFQGLGLNSHPSSFSKSGIATPNYQELVAMTNELNRVTHHGRHPHQSEESMNALQSDRSLGFEQDVSDYVKTFSLTLPPGFNKTLEDAILKSLSLLAYIPIIFTKFGENGVLLTRLISSEVSAMKPTEGKEATSSTQVHYKYFPGIKVPKEDIVSVNGVGDTFLAQVLLSLIMKDQNHGKGVDEIVRRAQQAAVDCLRSKESSWKEPPRKCCQEK